MMDRRTEFLQLLQRAARLGMTSTTSRSTTLPPSLS
jgi:hypothetical protein